MLPKSNRLTAKKDFDTVFKRGRMVRNAFCVIRALPNNRKTSRFGIMVSKKVSLSAVERNAIRRRLSAFFAKEVKSQKKAFDVVIVALPHIKGKSFSEISQGLGESFKKAMGEKRI